MSSAVEKQDQVITTAANGNQLDVSKETEIITFNSNEMQSCRSIKTNRTKVYTCDSTPGRGSSKVKLKNIVDYKWERKYYYPGHLVTVHRDGKHLAYAINVNNKANGMEGMVRVYNISTSLRALIKGMSGEVLDLQFAHTEGERILAIIDVSSLFVYKIDLIESNLACNLVLKVEDPISNYTPKYDMVSWCPYVSISSTREDDDENQLLLWSRSAQFQCFHVKMIVSEHGRGKIQPAALETGYLKIDEDTLITCAALSPDGTTVAAACADGVVRFYQIYLLDVRNHRCLHEWKPHDGKPVSSLFFLDNINKPVEDSYWQHVITMSDGNTEIKLWNCTLWECLQTINIVPAISPNGKPEFIAGIDRSANYLVISSLDSVSVYVMQINNNSSIDSALSESESDNDSTTNDSVVRIENIAEFKLSSGILSFSIVNASMRILKSTNESYYQWVEPDEYEDESASVINALVVHMFVVQMKSLQECQIIYQPERPQRSLNSSHSSCKTNKSIKNVEKSDDAPLLLHTNDIKQESLASPTSNSSNGSINANNSNANNVQLDSLFAKSTVVAVAVATTEAPATVLQDVTNANQQSKSRSASPQVGNTYPPLNLMTPDAFTACSTATVVAAATSTSTTNAGDANSASAVPDNVNAQVLKTIRMLATVTGQGTENSSLLKLMKTPLIEERAHQNLKEKIDPHKKFIAIDRNPERNTVDNLPSGGSSPSREVREIMATQDDPDTAYEAELENLDEVVAFNSPIIVDADEEDVDVRNWLPEKSTIKKSAELQNAAQIMSQAVHASGAQHKNNGNVPPSLGNNSSSNNNNSSSSNNNSLNSSHASNETAHNAEITSKLDQLMDLVKKQSQQINKLELEVSKLQQPQQKNASNALQPKSINELAYKIEMQLSKLMEQYLKRYENEHKKKLTEFLQARDTQNREMREAVMQILNTYVLKHFSDIISNILTMEVQRQIVPRVNAKLDQMHGQIQMETMQKLNVFEKTVSENIGQVCKSKQFLDAFGKSILMGVQSSLQTAFIESMSSTLIPAYEKSSQNMFKQLHDAFSVGIKEFMVQFNAHMQHLPLQYTGDNGEDLQNKLSLFRQQIETNLHKHRSAVTDAMLETQREVKSLELLLARQVQETIRCELRKYLETQSMAMRSQAATPAPTYDLRDGIKQLLHAGQINKAFHQALLANDLNLVEFTLRHTDQTLAFTPEGCRLEQKVLLSLIQQISADMSNHNELKQSYLNEALLAINMADPITREHAPKVLSDLYHSCQLFLKNCPKNTQCSNVRLLMKAIMTYRDQFK